MSMNDNEIHNLNQKNIIIINVELSIEKNQSAVLYKLQIPVVIVS